LLNTALGVLHLQDMPRTRIFVRRDRFDRYASILLFLPRERYNSDLREKIGAILAGAYGGRVSSYYPSFNDGPLARVHFIIGGFFPGHPEPDVAALEDRVVALARSWEDEFEHFARAEAENGEGADIARAYRKAFSAAYREAFLPEEALRDIAELKRLCTADGVRVRAYRVEGDPAEMLRCKIYSKSDQIPLSSAIPIFENLGLGPGDVLETAENANVGWPDIADHSRVWSRNSAEFSDFTLMIHAHFEHSMVGIGSDSENCQRQANMIVEVAAGSTATANAAEQMLQHGARRGFAIAAGDADNL